MSFFFFENVKVIFSTEHLILWFETAQPETLELRDLSEISRGKGVGILNVGSEMSWPIPAMGVKFANPPHDLGLKYHDPPPSYINDKI